MLKTVVIRNVWVLQTVTLMDCEQDSCHCLRVSRRTLNQKHKNTNLLVDVPTTLSAEVDVLKKNINVCDTYTINLCLFGDKLLTKVEYGDTHKLILNVMSSILIARQPLAEIL